MSYQSRMEAATFIKDATAKIESIMENANRAIMDVLSDVESQAEELYTEIENLEGQLERAQQEISEQDEEIEDLEREIHQLKREFCDE